MRPPIATQMIKAIILDVEGTASPIDFVHKTLFPFAKARMEDFLRENLASVDEEIAALKAEYRKDFQDQVYGRRFSETDIASIVKYLEWLIDVDRKSTPLKSIEGRIWRAGYESGELRSVVFPDVRPALERWRSEGKKIAIFSSGSVLAQRLIFRHSDAGDLGPLIDAYFDTTTGKKQESASYAAIARDLGARTADCLFISDSTGELDAARAAGLRTVLSVRARNGIVRHPIDHDAAGSFADVTG